MDVLACRRACGGVYIWSQMAGMMRARSKLKPGQPGTRKLVALYGDRLVCVRYRYDALKRRRYTTAEIIVAESEWDPLPSATARRERVGVRIEVKEAKLREKVKAAGGRWDPQQRLWHLPMEQVLQLGLEGRVAQPAAKSRPNPAQPGLDTDAF